MKTSFLRQVLRITAPVALFCCALGFGPSVPATAAPAQPVDQAAPSSGEAAYRLDTGDKVRVIVFDEDDLGGQFQIDDTGFIRLPLIGQLKAAESKRRSPMAISTSPG